MALFFFSCLFPFCDTFGLISLEWVWKEQLGKAQPNLIPTLGTWDSHPRQCLQTPL